MNLAGAAWLSARFLTRRSTLHRLERWQTAGRSARRGNEGRYLVEAMGQLDPHSDSNRQLALLADVGALLDGEGVDHWLLGGWAVDFHVGAVTRAHGDVDLAVWGDDANAVGSALVAAGWEHAPATDEDGGTG